MRCEYRRRHTASCTEVSRRIAQVTNVPASLIGMKVESGHPGGLPASPEISSPAPPAGARLRWYAFARCCDPDLR